jgi:hypothetical protein
MASSRTIGRSSARDPAAASFDADDEASGSAPTRSVLRQEREQLRNEHPLVASENNEQYTSARGQATIAVAVELLLVVGAAVLWFVMR